MTLRTESFPLPLDSLPETSASSLPAADRRLLPRQGITESRLLPNLPAVCWVE